MFQRVQNGRAETDAGEYNHVCELCTFLSSAPNAPPENVTAYNLSSTSVNVTWFPVPSHSLNGILQSYRVFYRDASVPHSPSMEIVVGNTTLSVVISALKKFTIYSVWVKAVTRAAGPSSTTVHVSTDEDGEAGILYYLVLQNKHRPFLKAYA